MPLLNSCLFWVLAIRYTAASFESVTDENGHLLRAFITQAEQTHKPRSLLLIFFNAFRPSRRISLKWIQGHLKGRGGKNWAYIFNANPADGALISPN